MNKAEQTGQREYCRKSLFTSQDDERGQCNNQNQKKKQRDRRNSSPFSYIEIIAYAILSSPQKRATLSEISVSSRTTILASLSTEYAGRTLSATICPSMNAFSEEGSQWIELAVTGTFTPVLW